jgi:hypothetical protein
MCRIYCGGFFEFAGSVVVVSYVKDGTLEFCCVVFVENVRWNVGVVTANKQGPFVAAEGCAANKECRRHCSNPLTNNKTGRK